MNRSQLTNLDITKLFEERSIDEIIQIEKLLDGEIERKRNDLRSMVGDRYKDILAASDAIKSMKTISEKIVSNIQAITKTCELLIDAPNSNSSTISSDSSIDKMKNEERILLIQMRMAIFLNEQIWIALDSGQNLNATQYYLLAQHIYMGLNLSKQEHLAKLPLLKHLRLNLSTLRRKIFEKVTEKLQSVEITPKETSQNLNALMLIENQTDNQLLTTFIEHRKTALHTVMNSHFSSVRVQIAAMVQCLITTVLLLHDCFIDNNNKNGLLWEELDNIVGENAPPTLSKLQLPVTPLVTYIPDIIKNFRPKLQLSSDNCKKIDKNVVDGWLDNTHKSVQRGLEKSLLLVTTIKGLFLVREESLKIELPQFWPKLCQDLHLPDNFDIWYHFFQKLITQRAEALISIIIGNSINDIKSDINSTLKSGALEKEVDLRWYVWREDGGDVGKFENDHTGLTMKTKGYSRSVVNLCENLDKKFHELLEDVSQYLYGTELNSQPQIPYLTNDFKFKRKFIDKEKLEKHLMMETTISSLEIPAFITDKKNPISQALFCARFLQAALSLCVNFHKCCEFGGTNSEWIRVCDTFTKTSHNLWMNWVKSCVDTTREVVKNLGDVGAKSVIQNVVKWDEIEIQEQTDEKTFKSQIKIPQKPSLPLINTLLKLNHDLNQILPFTLPKNIHLHFIQNNINVILEQYDEISSKNLNQIQALQFLLDLRFVMTLCVPRENGEMVNFAQNVCDKLRGKIDPFDLDVFYGYLQNNVRKSVTQSQCLFGSLLPSPIQLINVGAFTKNKEQESPSLMALSTPSTTSWFPLLPITAPSQKSTTFGGGKNEVKDNQSPKPKSGPKKSQDSASVMRQSAASLFGNFSTDWFS